MKLRSLAAGVLTAAACLASLPAVAAPAAEKAERIQLVNNNHVPQKLLVVYTYGNGAFVKDLFTVVKQINEQEHLSGADRLKLHIVTSGGDPVKELGITAADAEAYVEVNPKFRSSDIWMQDCMEICSAWVGGKHLQAVFDSNRGRGLAGLPKTLAEMWDLVYFKNPSTQMSHGDYGGNLEVTPFDDIMVAGNTITPSCKAFFEKMGYAGRLATPDTRWLTVGHIDEYISFIPTPHAPGGYSIVRADPGYALELLTNIDDGELSRLSSSDREFLLRVKRVLNAQYADPAAGRGTTEGAFIELNRAIGEIIEKNVGELKQFIRAATNDPDRDIAEVYWPSLYEGRGGSNPSGCCAYLPGVVNLTVVRNHLLVPACHIPSFDKVIEARFRAQGNTVHFIDDQPYHTSMGEIHCGTNVLRDPERTILTKRQIRAVQAVRERFRAIHGN
ncbi:MAG TPA: protein-arginine deiminase family protein [Candidatus Ozemobacteraceae bacterium]|nr:protein-arginine deiminase family protein [Candidatus Ozemobacteraceae bacterium]